MTEGSLAFTALKRHQNLLRPRFVNLEREYSFENSRSKWCRTCHVWGAKLAFRFIKGRRTTDGGDIIYDVTQFLYLPDLLRHWRGGQTSSCMLRRIWSQCSRSLMDCKYNLHGASSRKKKVQVLGGQFP